MAGFLKVIKQLLSGEQVWVKACIFSLIKISNLNGKHLLNLLDHVSQVILKRKDSKNMEMTLHKRIDLFLTKKLISGTTVDRSVTVVLTVIF